MAAALTDRPHHPHFVSAVTGADGTVTYEFRAFTGAEPRPECDWDRYCDDLDEADRRAYSDEIAAAGREWATVRFRHAVADVIADPQTAERWGAFKEARGRMDAAFTWLKNADASRWPASIAALLDAQDAAAAAAESWDATAAGIARLHYDLICEIGTDRAPRWYQVLEAAPDDWEFGSHGYERDQTFHYGTPVRWRTEETAKDQLRRVKTIAALAGGLDPR